jgi:hypothetical protein
MQVLDWNNFYPTARHAGFAKRLRVTYSAIVPRRTVGGRN